MYTVVESQFLLFHCDRSRMTPPKAPESPAAAIGWQTENSRDVIGQRRPHVVRSRRGTVAQLLGSKVDITPKYYQFGIKNHPFGHTCDVMRGRNSESKC